MHLLDIVMGYPGTLVVWLPTGCRKVQPWFRYCGCLLKVKGSVLIFDKHSEYVNTDFGQDKVNVMYPQINPLYLSFGEIKKLANIPPNAYVQERYFLKAYKSAKNSLMRVQLRVMFSWPLIMDKLEGWLTEQRLVTLNPLTLLIIMPSALYFNSLKPNEL